MDQRTKPMLEAKDDVKVVLEKGEPQYKIRLETHHRGLQLAAYLTPGGKGDILREKDVLEMLKGVNADGSLNREGLKELCSKACLGQPAADIILLEGAPPEDGKDEALEFLKLPSSDKPRYEKDVKGNIDYTKARLFDNVRPGDIVAILTEPGEGVSGKSVMGEPIPASKGLRMPEIPKCGDGVKFEADGVQRRYVASASGRIVFERNTISITDQFIVRGDVDYSVGHVDFVGHVAIGGDIQPTFNVKAGLSLKIKGNANQCVIESAGDMEIGGMTGGETGRLICGGTLHARYINDAYVECKGDLRVKNEIVNCHVKCGGMIDVNLGSVVGGSCMALTGIEAKGLGSDAGVKTRLTCGVCYMALAKMEAIHAELDPMRKEVETLSKKLEPLIKNPKAMLGLSPRDRELVKENAKRLNELLPIQERLQKELKEIEADMDRRGNPIINARGYLGKCVQITLGAIVEETLTENSRPITIIRNSRKGCLRYLPLHQITERYKDIERELVRKEDEDERLERERKLKEQRAEG